MHIRWYGRPLSGYGAKLSRDRLLGRVRKDLDAWGFRSRVVATQGAYGGIDVGFCEILTLVCDDGFEAGLEDVLCITDWSVPSRGQREEGLRPQGVTGLLLPDDVVFNAEQSLSAEQFKELGTWMDLRIRPGADNNSVTRLAAVDGVLAGELAMVGAAWRLPLTDLRTYVVIRLLEATMGSDHHYAVLRPVREAGRAYALVTRYFYEIGVFAVFAICRFADETEKLIMDLLGRWSATSAALGCARRRLCFLLNLSPLRAFNGMAPYALLDPSVTAQGVRQLMDDIEVDEVNHLMDRPWQCLRKRVPHELLL